MNPSSRALTLLLALVALSGAACTELRATVAPIDCGHYAVTDGTASEAAPQAKRCILDALEDGAPAYLEQDVTAEGDTEPVVVRFDVLRKDELRVTTGDHDQLCTGIADDGPALTGVDCEDLTEEG